MPATAQDRPPRNGPSSRNLIASLKVGSIAVEVVIVVLVRFFFCPNELVVKRKLSKQIKMKFNGKCVILMTCCLSSRLVQV